MLDNCPGKILCQNCKLLQQEICTGCNAEYFQRCFKNECGGNCEICGGGKRATVPASCGRSHNFDQWSEVFRMDTPLYSPPAPEIKHTLLPVTFAQIANLRIPEYFPAIDHWVAPVHKVMNLQGKFRSSDLKDYLGLSKEHKLILSTSAPDDFMEVLWDRRETLDFERSGIDYWFPAHFSIYDDDCKFYQFYNAKRQQIHAMTVKSQFAWFRLGENIPIQFLAPMRSTKAILISCQQMYSSRNRQILEKEVVIADEWFPQSTKFFFMGRGGLDLNKLAQHRAVFQINERWLILALKGRTMNNQPSKLDRKDLLLRNLKEVCDACTKFQ